jgi:hypothetical protein
MSKQCEFCKAEMADDAVQCPECEKYIRGYENTRRKKIEKKKSRNQIILIIFAVVAFIIILFAVVNSVLDVVNNKNVESDSDYSKVFDRYIDATLNMDYDEFISLYPDFYASEIDEMFSYVCGSSSEYLEMLNETMVRQFGSLNEITYEINSEGVAKDEKVESYKDEWVNLYGMSEDADVSAVYIIDADFTVSGRNYSDDINQNVMLAKIDGKWYLMNIMYLFDTEEATATTVE